MIYLRFEIKVTMTGILSRNEKILANAIGSETVMMDIEKGKYFGMNKTGSYIWKLLENPLSLSDLCDRLMKDFSISFEECEKDVVPFIEDMVKEKIINVH